MGIIDKMHYETIEEVNHSLFKIAEISNARVKEIIKSMTIDIRSMEDELAKSYNDCNPLILIKENRLIPDEIKQGHDVPLYEVLHLPKNLKVESFDTTSGSVQVRESNKIKNEIICD